MTKELLKNANKKIGEIRKMEDFIEAFKEPYINSIYAFAYGTLGAERKQVMIIDSDSELYDLILNHCNSELERLKEEFKKL